MNAARHCEAGRDGSRPGRDANLGASRDRQRSGAQPGCMDFHHCRFYQHRTHATDGQPRTRWRSENADLQWIYVDLGAVLKIRSVTLCWGANHASAYKIQVSSDHGPSPETGLWKDGETSIRPVMERECRSGFVGYNRRKVCSTALQRKD